MKPRPTHVIGNDYDDPPKIAVKADEGTHFLYFAFTHDLQDSGIADQKPLSSPSGPISINRSTGSWVHLV